MKKNFSALTRNLSIDELANEKNIFDLVIVGGGITGAGVARDAASRGMSVALVEARDFAEGTSSRSSKLIHGGIRYLENLEFGLVFEALRERARLFEIAPFLVHPMRFLLPVYKGSRVGMFQMGLGMWLYDALAMFDTPYMHEALDAKECLQVAPFLEPKDLKGGYLYADAYMDDDRLVHETLRSAHRFGAVCVNHVRATGAVFGKDNRIQAVKCHDELTNKEFEVRGRYVISTVGPWTDELASMILPDWKKIMRPSKGIHLTLDRKRLELNDAVVMVSDDQKRIVFAIPRHEMIVIGTTDTDYKEKLENVHSTKEDVEYLLHVTGEHFPQAKITVDDVLASYAGVRPLVEDGSKTESKTSREHVILHNDRGLTFVAGGKYTTYRHMAEQTVKQVLDFFPTEDQLRFRKSHTLQPLNPLATQESLVAIQQMSGLWARQFSRSEELVRKLSERHGEETPQILAQGADIPESPSLLWQLEALHAIQSTMCMRLVDFYLRRVPLFLTQRDHGFSMLEQLADFFAERLGWDELRRKREIQAVKDHNALEMGWKTP